MGEPKLKPIPFKSLPSPFLRLMPTLFAYVRMADADEDVSPEVHQEAANHLEALRAFLAAAAQGAGLARQSVRPLRNLCSTMTTVRGDRLAGTFAELIEGMQVFYRVHRESLRKAMANSPELFHQLYREEVHTKNILTVFNEATWSEAEKLGAKLTESCWYSYQPHRARDGMIWLDGVDFVLFAPGQHPTDANLEEAVANADVPFVVLAGWGGKQDEPDMASLRTEYRYRQSGCNVLHGPFAPFRLYSTIDGLYLKNLDRQLESTGRRMVVDAG